MSQAGLPVQTDSVAAPRCQPPAGFWIRVLAILMDALVLGPLGLLAFAALSAKSLKLAILVSISGFIYKPLMESYYGATLGKMACGLQVMDEHGRRLSLGAAYVRFLPWLAQAVVRLISMVWLFSTPQFQTVSGFLELGQLMEQGPLDPLSTLLTWVILIDGVTAAFTDRKRAIHDMMAGSYCVWKDG